MMWKEQEASQREHRLVYAAVFFCFFVLYAVTAQRGVSWQDSGEFQYRVLAGDYRWHSGIARAHPLYIAMARGFAALFPAAACFYAVNLFSGLGLSVALALLAANVVRLTRSVRAAALAVSVLGFAHMAWWLGTVAEVYTWSLAFLMAEVLCLIRYAERRDGRWLIALFAVNGLHVSLHNAALIGLPVYAFLLVSEVWRQRGRAAGAVCGCAAAWMLGSGLILWQAACLLRETGAPAGVLKSVLFGEGYERQVLGTGGFAFKLWAANMALAGVSFVNPCWLFAGRGFLVRGGEGPVGVWRWLRVLTVLHGLFWVRYFVPDQATFVVPTLGLLAIWVGRGGAMRTGFLPPAADGGYASKIQVRPAPPRPTPLGEEGCGAMRPGFKFRWVLAAGVACAVAGPWLLCEVAQRTGLQVERNRALPFRDEAGYWLKPWKQGERSAARFVDEVGKQLGAGDVLMADSTSAGPLLAARESGGLAKGWRLVTPWSGETGQELVAGVEEGERKTYVVSPVAGYAPQSLLAAGCRFEPAGAVYRVIGNRQSAIGKGQ